MNHFVVLFSVIVLAAGTSIKFKSCPDPHGVGYVLPKSVDISPCTNQPCVFNHGQSVVVTVAFDAVQDESNLKAAIYGYVAGVPVSFNMPNSDGCKDSGIVCPTSKGSSYNYKSAFKVLPEYPNINVVVEWLLNGTDANANTKNDFCFTFPVRIQ